MKLRKKFFSTSMFKRTLRSAFDKPVTVMYPTVKPCLPEKYRGRPVFDYSLCIGCGLCVKACKFGAIEFENKIAKINYDKCVQCMECVEKCPTKVIKGNLDNRKKVTIDEELCIGCTICKKQCKFDAIEGELKEKHKIDLNKCVGCHLCLQKCPKKAIKTI